MSEISKLLNINYRIIVIYDYDDDPTIKVVNDNFNKKEIIIVKNKHVGFNGAVKTAFEMLNAKAVILYPADDHKNFNLINEMFKKFNEGYDIVCASRVFPVPVSPTIKTLLFCISIESSASLFITLL